MPHQDLIALEVTNNSTFPIESILLQGSNNANPSGAKLLFPYNFATEDFIGVTGMNIEYALASNVANKIVLNTTLPENNLNGVLTALNELGIGVFFLNGTTIYTYSDFYIYYDINIV